MYCTEKCLSFTLIPLKRNSFGYKSFTFKNRLYEITYHSNFNYKNFALLDCITYYLRSAIVNQVYKEEDQNNPPFRPGDNRIPDNIKMYGSFIDKDFIKSFYISDDMIRKHPMFKKWKNGWEIFNFIKKTSKIEFENFNYYYVSYHKQDNRFEYKPFPILERCNLFDVSITKKCHGCNLYRIDFNSLFGKIFAYNVNVSNFYLLRDSFYELDGISQSIYRFFSMFGTDKLDIDIEKIYDLLEYNITNNKTNVERRVLEMFEKMKKLSLVRSYTFKHGVIEITN